MHGGSTKNPLNLEINTHFKHRRRVSDLAPSDPKFDRSHISEKDYIELLLFENKELQSTLKKREQYIDTLQELLSKHGISPEAHISSSPLSVTSKDSYVHPLDKIIPSASTSSQFSARSNEMAVRTPLDNGMLSADKNNENKNPVEGDIPQRSARRRPTSHVKNDSIISQERKSSFSSITSDLPKSTSTFSGLSTSTSFGTHVANMTGTDPTSAISKNNPEETIQANTDDIASESTDVNTKPLPPITNETTNNSTSSQIGAGSAVMSEIIEHPSKEATPKRSLPLTPDQRNESHSSEAVDSSAISVKGNDNSIIDTTASSTDINNSTNSIVTAKRTNSSGNNNKVTQHKNASTSSFSSYKSRIKLPPTLQHQQNQREASSPKELTLEIPDSSTSDSNQNNKTQMHKSETMSSLKSPVSQEVATPSSANRYDQHSLPSASASITHKVDSPNSAQLTSQISATDSIAKVPGTPEAFGGVSNSDKFTPLPFAEVNTFPASPYQSSASPRLNDHDSNLLRTPVANNLMSTDSFGSTRPSAQTPGSSFNVIHTPKPEEEDVNLIIKPEEFHTITIKIASTISVYSKKSEDPNFTLSINDRESGKEMWRIRKTYTQLQAFDNEIRPIVDCFGLPPVPDRALFSATTPSKIDTRKDALQNYFNTIFVMPHIPHMILHRICRYLSLDFVSPLDDFRSGARKEGFLIRRYKGLGTSWKVRWCQVDGPVLEIYESPGGTLLEQIKLKGTQIGRQSNDNVAEDKGYRHAFLILETTKASKLSSYPKHFFCTESDEERDEWIDALIEFNSSGDNTGDTSLISNGSADASGGGAVIDSAFLETPSSKYDYQDELEQNSKPYTSLSSNSMTPGSAYNPGNDLESTNTVYSQEDPSQTYKDVAAAAAAAAASASKKLKKRSIFPFRYKGTSNSGNHAFEDDNNATPPQTPLFGNNGNFGDNTPSSSSSRNHTTQSHQHHGHGHSDQGGIGGTPYAEPSIQSYLDQMNLDEDVAKAIFGREISEAYNLSSHEFLGRKIPSIIFRCLDFLMRTGGVYEEGIFRLSGSASTIRQLKDQFNTQFDLDLFESNLKPDMHTVAGLLKTYLRELPAPVMGSQAYNQLQSLVMKNNHSKEELARQFKQCLNDSANIDTIHYDMCFVMFKFLRQIIANSSSNRMNLRNVCIVFVPTLNVSLDILITLIVDFDCIFEGGEPADDSSREVLDLQIPNF